MKTRVPYIQYLLFMKYTRTIVRFPKENRFRSYTLCGPDKPHRTHSNLTVQFRCLTYGMDSVGVHLLSGESACRSPLSRRVGWSVSAHSEQTQTHSLLSSPLWVVGSKWTTCLLTPECHPIQSARVMEDGWTTDPHPSFFSGPDWMAVGVDRQSIYIRLPIEETGGSE